MIELLVVIAIIGLLAAILFPVFGRARENARRSTCQSNLKQIGLGAQQYMQDFDEYYLPYSTDRRGINGSNSSAVEARGWPDLVYPYIKNSQIYVCPSDSGVRNRNYPYANDNPIGTKLSYLYNAIQPNTGAACNQATGLVTAPDYDRGFIALGSAADPITASVKESGVPSPSTKFFITEGTNYPTNPSYTGGYLYGVCATTTLTTLDLAGTPINTQFGGSGTNSMLGALHFEGYNVLYADGHVKWIKFGSSKIGNWISNAP